ncbi:MAG: AAA domain-containing protein [Pirellulaceae bacterium]
MSDFYDFLSSRLEQQGFSTEDTLVSFLPLVRDVIAAHAQGRVAPLRGLDQLHVEGSEIWFEQDACSVIKMKLSTVESQLAELRAPLDVVGKYEEDGSAKSCAEVEQARLPIGEVGQEIEGPLFLPNYVCWEHELDHHDPLTDVFSLGMILASLACGLDFSNPADLEAFVEHRDNLFALNAERMTPTTDGSGGGTKWPQLHPVVARAIHRMTELDRAERVQDLTTLLNSLENFRYAEVDFEFDLAQVKGFGSEDLVSKRQIVMAKLQKRLFEISRRNRLLNFRETMQNVDLTLASVPLTHDVSKIRAKQLFTSDDRLQKLIVSEKPFSLNRHLNFSEALYLPVILDRIRKDVRRDEAEYGFSQLRLVTCFLNWTDLKDNAKQRFLSPLILVPVKLVRKKGIQDSYSLQALSSEVEVNPVLRYQFQQLYGIKLPTTLDLLETDLDAFYDFLEKAIHSTEPGITLEKIDRPQIEVIHAKAQQSLESYRRRSHSAGRGVRNYHDFAYSYDPVNFQPLGLKLFHGRVMPDWLTPREVEAPEPVESDGEETDLPAAAAEEAVAETRAEGTGEEAQQASACSVPQTRIRTHDMRLESPYHWQFDLCRVTLGNFRYRKMSLVRDYEILLESDEDHAPFDATFSLVPRSAQAPDEELELKDRYQVVPCDPTQMTAIAAARGGKSYIIQGPPGTGKSQTITNLIADFVVRGKRVLFVCEKRAAIDVVYLRLKQQGLGHLCSLIHDSQADKKSFVMDLKTTYESFLQAGSSIGKHERTREKLLKKINAALTPLQEFDRMMTGAAGGAEVPLMDVLQRAIAMKKELPELTALQREQLPDYDLWQANRTAVERFDRTWHEMDLPGVFADHPCRLLNPHLANVDRPLQQIAEALEPCADLFQQVREGLQRSQLPGQYWDTVSTLSESIERAKGLEPFVRQNLLRLLDPEDPQAIEFQQGLDKLAGIRKTLVEQQKKTTFWRKKLPPEELQVALQRAAGYEGKWTRVFQPGWWRLRSLLIENYDYTKHLLRPTRTQILETLAQEYQRQDEVAAAEEELLQRFALTGELAEIVEQIEQTQNQSGGLSATGQTFLSVILRLDDPSATVTSLLELRNQWDPLAARLGSMLQGYHDQSLSQTQKEVESILANLDDLPSFLVPLAELASLPPAVIEVLRKVSLSMEQMEGAIVGRSVQRRLQSHRHVGRFTGSIVQRYVDELGEAYDEWLGSNAAVVQETARINFLEQLEKTSFPLSELTADEKTFKKKYDKGRKELEHEFGKQMRYKAIRDLVTEDSGLVVKDLKPIWLMSPLSVSDTLPLNPKQFDVVIFDEASQITLEEAVPSIYRAPQVIVVGDEMQLPPTNFFSANRHDDGDEAADGTELEDQPYDIDSNSFLNHSAKNLPSTMLGWHYRSRNELLISFSNWAFYQGRLLTIPEEELTVFDRPALLAQQAEDAQNHVDEVLDRPISFHYMEHGVYLKRRNRAEADYIAQLVRSLLNQPRKISIGIVAFSEAQQNEIEMALQRLAQDDADFMEALETEYEREEDGEFVGLLVKNLENIQGDERDLVIMSVCYGYNEEGRMFMNFGPINKSGGEKRLNVAFSRAKHHMALVSSIRDYDITNDYNHGANCLKNYIRYASAVSEGNIPAVQNVLRDLARWRDLEEPEETAAPEVVRQQLADKLKEHGYEVDHSIGHSEFQCDLGVYKKDDSIYRLGILIDGEAHYQQSDVLERDLMRPRLLRAFGWRTHRVLTVDWFARSAEVFQEILAALVAAEPPPAPPAEPPVDPAPDSTVEATAEATAEPPVEPATDSTIEPAAGSASDLPPDSPTGG